MTEYAIYAFKEADGEREYEFLAHCVAYDAHDAVATWRHAHPTQAEIIDSLRHIKLVALVDPCGI